MTWTNDNPVHLNNKRNVIWDIPFVLHLQWLTTLISDENCLYHEHVLKLNKVFLRWICTRIPSTMLCIMMHAGDSMTSTVLKMLHRFLHQPSRSFFSVHLCNMTVDIDTYQLRCEQICMYTNRKSWYIYMFKSLLRYSSTCVPILI